MKNGYRTNYENECNDIHIVTDGEWEFNGSGHTFRPSDSEPAVCNFSTDSWRFQEAMKSLASLTCWADGDIPF